MSSMDKNKKLTRMSNRADRLTNRANKIVNKGSSSYTVNINGKDTTFKTTNQTKKSDRLLFKASVLKGRSISDPFEKARYISNLPEGRLKDKVTKRGVVQKIKDKRTFRSMKKDTGLPRI